MLLRNCEAQPGVLSPIASCQHRKEFIVTPLGFFEYAAVRCRFQQPAGPGKAETGCVGGILVIVIRVRDRVGLPRVPGRYVRVRV